MIISRTPLRISLGGGGTDLPSYYKKFGGFFVSGAINQYVYIALHPTFQRNFIIKYSRMERVQEIAEIGHPIVREAFKMHALDPALEMVSMADIPAGTGLGSSGAFGVGLLRAIHSLKREPIEPGALAEQASHIEMNLLGEPTGKQDTYIAAFGGLTCFEIDRQGVVTVSRLKISRPTQHDLEDNMLLFFTGYSRSASAVLADQRERTERQDSKMIDNLHQIRELGVSIRARLEAGDTRGFGRLLHEHWLVKQGRSSSITNSEINRWYQVALDHGALGGKLIGAGGGGFLLFYTQDRERLREAMTKEGLTEVRFSFEHEGSRILVQS